jgi:hypothetical protein
MNGARDVLGPQRVRLPKVANHASDASGSSVRHQLRFYHRLTVSQV